MKGPMKGATIAHSKQRKKNGRYIGVSEPGIIAAEAPNPIVNSLVIMPDMEKRLEAFVRIGHGIIVFPGGVGTAEEILARSTRLVLPVATLVVGVFSAISIIFAATTYDSASYILASVATRRLEAGEDPARWHRVFWAGALALLPLTLMFVQRTVPNALSIVQDRITRSRLAGDPAEVVLSPRLAHIGMLEFHHAPDAIEEGERCVASAMPDIQRLLQEG